VKYCSASETGIFSILRLYLAHRENVWRSMVARVEVTRSSGSTPSVWEYRHVESTLFFYVHGETGVRRGGLS
jgi:hypothetical protein